MARKTNKKTARKSKAAPAGKTAKSPARKASRKSAAASGVPAHPVAAQPALRPGQPEIRYRVRMPKPWTHNLEITIELKGLDPGEAVLRMPSWTPGSYKIREFCRNVSHFRAFDGAGELIRHSQTAKDTWRVPVGADGVVRAAYRIYSFELSVRTPHVDDRHGFFQPTNALMFVEGQLETPATLTVEPYQGWKVFCPLPYLEKASRRGGKAPSNVQPGSDWTPLTLAEAQSHSPDPVTLYGPVKAAKDGTTGPGPASFVAASYDVLADAPVECGDHPSVVFAVGGKRHEIAAHGWGNFDLKQMAGDFPGFIKAASAMFGGKLPYQNYLFVLHFLPNNRGGLEHLNSQVSAWPSQNLETREQYEDFLSLISHEFFHTWNVKRIRPEMLGPFDYTSEQYTDDLWVMEGFTVYYEWVMLARGGLVTRDRVWRSIEQEVNRWDDRPGNLVMPLDESSRLAWVKLYLADENFVNTGVSYYLKGFLVAGCLDMELRARTKGKQSLDDLMRRLYADFGWPKPGFPKGTVQALAEEIAGGPLTDFWQRHLHSADPLDLSAFLGPVGLELVRDNTPPPIPANGDTTPRTEQPYLGWEIRSGAPGIGITVAAIRDGSPASDAGLSAKDEVIALNGIRVSTAAEAELLIRRNGIGKPLEVAFFRDGQLRSLTTKPTSGPAGRWRVMPVARPTAAQVAAQNAWLG